MILRQSKITVWLFQVNVMMKSSSELKLNEQKDKENLLIQTFYDLENDYMEKVFHQPPAKN